MTSHPHAWKPLPTHAYISLSHTHTHTCSRGALHTCQFCPFLPDIYLHPNDGSKSSVQPFHLSPRLYAGMLWSAIGSVQPISHQTAEGWAGEGWWIGMQTSMVKKSEVGSIEETQEEVRWKRETSRTHAAFAWPPECAKLKYTSTISFSCSQGGSPDVDMEVHVT